MFKVTEVFDVYKVLLTVTGCWPEKNRPLTRQIRAILCNVILLAYIFTLYLQFNAGFGDYFELLTHMLNTLTPSTCFIKVLLFKIKAKNLLPLMDHLEGKEFCNLSLRYAEMVRASYRVTKITCNTMLFATLLTVTMVCLPIVKGDLIHTFTYDLGAFEYCMGIFQAIGTFNAAYHHMIIDAVVMSFATICAAQIDVLNDSICNVICNDSSETYERIKSCVVHHNEIIMLVQRLEKQFSGIILAQYVSSGLAICLLGFQMMHVPLFSMQGATWAAYLTAMFLQTALYCWFGNEIIYKSSAIRDACYESRWLDSDYNIRKHIYLIMEKSKKPLRLTAGGFAVLSLSAFASIIKTAYSYFALMQTLYAKGGFEL